MKTLISKTTMGILFSLLIGLLCLVGCSDSNPVGPNNNNNGNKYTHIKGKDYKPGHIPGMGDAKGPLTGVPFQLPKGVELVGKITGISGSDYKNADKMIGSGSGAVWLHIKLKNHLSHVITVVLPAGLTFYSNDSTYQSGILIQKVRIHISKGDTIDFLIFLDCVNLNREPSDSDAIYNFGPVTNADPMLELIQLLKGKHIGYENFNGLTSFLQAAEKIQNIIWDITNGNGMTDKDRAYIKSLK